ncbi:MAG: S8 family peptidase [Flavobacteriales bacterium]|nr:S8 family peptidase [Flavobacteriales bacterium]
MRHLLTAVSIALATVAVAQVPQKMNVQLRTHLQRVQGTDAMVDLFLRGNDGALSSAVLSVGGVVKQRMTGIVNARVPAGRVAELAAMEVVECIEFTMIPGRSMNDSMRVHNRVNPVQQGMAPLTQGYTGSGVVVGVIDQGCDWRHGDFQLNDGRTRIQKFWGQTYSFDALLTPQPYNYGRVWDSTMINTLQCPASDQPGTFGHGSTVTGAAVGDGSLTGNCKGVAPDADIVVISSNLNAANWQSTVVDGVRYVYDYAESVGKPAVVNLSAGSYLGSHDGQDAAALLIDSMLNAEPGRVFVCAAGNSGQFPKYHMRTVSDADTAFTWYRVNTQSFLGYPSVYFDLWGDSAEMVNLEYAMGANLDTLSFADRGRTPFHDIVSNVGGMYTDAILNGDGDTLGVVDFFAEQRGGQYHLEVHMQQPDSADLNWRFMTTGNGMHDVWCIGAPGWMSYIVGTNLPDQATLPSIANYVLPDSLQQIVDSWACSPHTLTVANYTNEEWYIGAHQDTVFVTPFEGIIDGSSSKGPARTGLMKPDIGATGAFTFSPGPLSTMAAMLLQPNNVWKVHQDSLHMRNAGTSMASPVIAGIAALYLEKCPNATHAEVIAAIHGSAYIDQYTGSVPNYQWGYGKVDAFAAVSGNHVDFDADTLFCEGDSVLVSGPGGVDQYVWSNGLSDAQFYQTDPGQLSLQVVYSSGCTGSSDTAVFFTNPAPAQPTITENGVVLTSTPATAYQWFLEGNAIGSANDQDYEVTVNGNYQVQVTDANGCAALSDTLYFGSIGIEETESANGVHIWPSPTNGELNVFLPVTSSSDAFLYEVVDAEGKLVASGTFASGQPHHKLGLAGIANGLYALRLVQGDTQWVQGFLAE